MDWIGNEVFVPAGVLLHQRPEIWTKCRAFASLVVVEQDYFQSWQSRIAESLDDLERLGIHPDPEERPIELMGLTTHRDGQFVCLDAADVTWDPICGAHGEVRGALVTFEFEMGGGFSIPLCLVGNGGFPFSKSVVAHGRVSVKWNRDGIVRLLDPSACDFCQQGIPQQGEGTYAGHRLEFQG